MAKLTAAGTVVEGRGQCIASGYVSSWQFEHSAEGQWFDVTVRFCDGVGVGFRLTQRQLERGNKSFDVLNLTEPVEVWQSLARGEWTVTPPSAPVPCFVCNGPVEQETIANSAEGMKVITCSIECGMKQSQAWGEAREKTNPHLPADYIARALAEKGDYDGLGALAERGSEKERYWSRRVLLGVERRRADEQRAAIASIRDDFDNLPDAEPEGIVRRP